MTTRGSFVGIDVAKAELVVGVRPGGVRWSVRNDAVRLERLRDRLQGLAPALVVGEPALLGHGRPVGGSDSKCLHGQSELPIFARSYRVAVYAVCHIGADSSIAAPPSPNSLSHK